MSISHWSVYTYYCLEIIVWKSAISLVAPILWRFWPDFQIVCLSVADEA